MTELIACRDWLTVFRLPACPGLLEGFVAGTRLDFNPFCNPHN
jgi:hypothetical protein